MTLIWLIAWLCWGCPPVYAWNGWLIGLIVVVALDLIGNKEAL